MKSLNSFLSERTGTKAHREAVAMGLKYKGFGYWMNAEGKVTHRTENDQLIPVDPEVEAEKAEKVDDVVAQDATGGGERMSVGGASALGSGAGILGTADPAQGAQRPAEMGWTAGPDGDNCVNDQEPGQVPADSYVGKTNSAEWQAGADGNNFTNVREAAEQQSMGLTDAGYKEKEVTNKAKAQMKRVVGKGPAQGRTEIEGKEALRQMRGSKGQQTAYGKQLASLMKIANRQAAPDPMATNIKAPNQSDIRRNEDNKEADMWHKVAKLPAVAKDSQAVSEMNKIAKGFVQDPNYDMTIPSDSDEDSENFLDAGAFGQVFLKDDGNVIKKGQIGPGELEALHAMRDNPNFPTLINAKFDSPFRHLSTVYNNPMNADNEHRGPAGYWDPDDASDFDDKFPGAEGTYAMTQAKGSPLYQAEYDMDEEMMDKAMRNFWRARGDLHKAGFSHNDMHGGNIFVDPETGDVNIIDLGLAKNDPRSALMEALGGMDFEEGEDYQLASQVSGAKLPERLRDTFLKNRERVEEFLQDQELQPASDYDDYDEDQDYSPTFTQKFDRIYDMMRGGIRMRQEDLDNLAEDLPYLQDDNNVKKLIGMLYDEVGQSELADRMSDAFEKRQADSDIIRKANRIRANRGEKPLTVRNPNVVPPENLDFDD